MIRGAKIAKRPNQFFKKNKKLGAMWKVWDKIGQIAKI
jgi:hypothetical protein